MTSIGYLFLCDSMIALWKRNVESVMPLHQTPPWVQVIARLLRLLLLASIGTIIASSVEASELFDASSPPTQSSVSQIVHLRHASYCLSLGMYPFPS